MFAEFIHLFSSEINFFANFRYYCFAHFRNTSEFKPVLRFNATFNYQNVQKESSLRLIIEHHN